MSRYYPRWTTILIVPVGVAAVLGVPFVDAVWGPVRSVVIFVVVLVLWRRFLRVELRDNRLHGRNPESLRLTALALDSVVTVQSTLFAISRVPGWSFADGKGRAVFVNEGALANETIRNKIEATQSAEGSLREG